MNNMQTQSRTHRIGHKPDIPYFIPKTNEVSPAIVNAIKNKQTVIKSLR